jgi:hypothetical protein
VSSMSKNGLFGRIAAGIGVTTALIGGSVIVATPAHATAQQCADRAVEDPDISRDQALKICRNLADGDISWNECWARLADHGVAWLLAEWSCDAARE